MGKRGAQGIEQGDREMLGTATLARVFPHTTGKLDGNTARRRLASCGDCLLQAKRQRGLVLVAHARYLLHGLLLGKHDVHQQHRLVRRDK